VAAEDFLRDVQVRQSPGDPLLAPLQRVRGKIGDDGIERISTQTLFDYLEVRQPNRGAGACRGLANVMRQFGWSPLRVRGLTWCLFRKYSRTLPKTIANARAIDQRTPRQGAKVPPLHPAQR
jgi:hypothetical protein